MYLWFYVLHSFLIISFPFNFLFFIFFYHPIEMESYVDEIIQEWYTKLRELEEINQNIKAEGLVLKDLRIRFMFIKKYFEDKTLSKKQKNFLNVKSSSLTALNVMKEKEMMKIKKAYKEIIELENIEDPFKPKEEKKIKMTGVQRAGVNLEEKLRVIRRPREKKDDNKVKVVNKKRDDEKVVNEKSIEEKGVSVKSDKKVFVKEKAVEEKGFNKELGNVKSDKETVLNDKVDNEMLVKEKVDDEKLVNIKRDDRKGTVRRSLKRQLLKGRSTKIKATKRRSIKRRSLKSPLGQLMKLSQLNNQSMI
ncbi:hypothetical protein NBO_13g0035 [Nosema bombycis CQ1]|uniref:Uncharacterized protein n=1 Tax=Nosema bombycis (strain CQ1 / CVCC 102059) TaxID=578461 RepID=R0MPS1_NOSB1|nr:hypothetical protein NBO_13g0035 [Nosema bombycis CQ1]|eukprot:EOB14858.1 hypothetical protein NBO_13g0035 [Nosema bombycis CQ1]